MSTSTRLAMIKNPKLFASTTRAQFRNLRPTIKSQIIPTTNPNLLLTMKVNAFLQLFRTPLHRNATSSPSFSSQNLTLATSTTISSDIIHGILTANSTTTIQSLLQQVRDEQQVNQLTKQAESIINQTVVVATSTPVVVPTIPDTSTTTSTKTSTTTTDSTASSTNQVASSTPSIDISSTTPVVTATTTGPVTSPAPASSTPDTSSTTTSQ